MVIGVILHANGNNVGSHYVACVGIEKSKTRQKLSLAIFERGFDLQSFARISRMLAP